MLALAVPLAGCTSSADGSSGAPASAGPTTPAAEPAEAGQPVQLVSARLQDAVEPLPDDRISWRTTWRACFAPADAADDIARWESRVTTTEGASPEVHELPDGCLDIDVASGVSATDSGMPGRDLQLFDAQRLAYQVRLVRPDGTVTPWTDRVLVGTVTPAG